LAPLKLAFTAPFQSEMRGLTALLPWALLSWSQGCRTRTSGPGVVVVGGMNDRRIYSTSVFPPSPCSLPPLESWRGGHSLSLLDGRLVACGGSGRLGTPSSSCESWSPGSPTWSSSYTMRDARTGHLAWTPPTRPGTLLLMGGSSGLDTNSGGRLTGEELPGGANFTLEGWGVYFSCGIEDGPTFIVTGGVFSDHVTRLGPTGAVEEELPPLPEVRWSHGCGTYPTGAGQALLVAGGITREPRGDLDGETISSVVTLLPKATTWTLLSALPRRLKSAASSMVGGRLWLVGGRGPLICSDLCSSDYRAEVLQYEPSTDTWTTKGNLTEGMGDHGVVAVGAQDLPCLGD